MTDDDRAYQNWARWIDSRVDRVPTSCTVALWVGVLYLVIKGL